MTDNVHLVDSGSLSGRAYADFGPAFSGSDFFDLETFRDGTLVETFSGPGGLSGGVSFGLTAIDGSSDINTFLQDQLARQTGEAWELNSGSGQPFDETILRGIFSMSDFTTPPQNPLGGLNGGVNGVAPGGGYADIFTGLAGTQLNDGTITSLSFNGVPYDFAVQSRVEGSFSKAIMVPEPASLVIFGAMGLSVIGIRRRR